ncbi:MAG: hypothetical protein GY791_07785 [Alphaproteobacteria bacterium]|nr:hypothetical protein [Alphaproteobacteria bacterium]
MESGNIDAAKDHVEELLAGKGDDPNLLKTLATIEFLRGNYEEATDIAWFVLQLTPGDKSAAILFFAADSASRKLLDRILWRPFVWIRARGWKGSSIFFAIWLMMGLLLPSLAFVTGYYWWILGGGLALLGAIFLIEILVSRLAEKAVERASIQDRVSESSFTETNVQ